MVDGRAEFSRLSPEHARLDFISTWDFGLCTNIAFRFCFLQHYRLLHAVSEVVDLLETRLRTAQTQSRLIGRRGVIGHGTKSLTVAPAYRFNTTPVSNCPDFLPRMFTQPPRQSLEMRKKRACIAILLIRMRGVGKK